jgi:predicted dehydrogenase
MIRIAIIGYGYWGPNIVRNFFTARGIEVVSICDSSPGAREKVSNAYSCTYEKSAVPPVIRLVSDYNEVVNAPDIDAVAVVTPVSTHYEIVRKALLNGKHVFVEKPFTSSVREAEELIEIADRKGLTLMVDHTFLFTGAVRKIKELIDGNVLGNIYYFDSTRVNLGLFQHDVNVIWDLAPHDLSIMDYVIGEKPVAISTTGTAHLNGKEDAAFITIYFENQIIAHFNVNWLSPVKIRNTLIGGDKQMLVWNDLETDEKIKVYNRGADLTTRESIHELLVSYRSGDVWIPKVDQIEALKMEADYFVDCIMNRKAPINDGAAGLRVVRILEAANTSLRQRGAPVTL